MYAILEDGAVEYKGMPVPGVLGVHKTVQEAKDWLTDFLSRMQLQTIDRCEAQWIDFKHKKLECVFVFIGEGNETPEYVIVPV